MRQDHDGLDPFYPIVPDAGWVRRLAQRDVRSIQLRVKDKPSDAVHREVSAALEAVAGTRATLIVNDHWREALAAGAGYVHLGQEDLGCADIGALKTGKVRIGISTHDDKELARALALEPDYIALGPIYATQSKSTGFTAQGLDRIGQWKRRIGGLPLVAIGGITLERASGVIAAGARSVAVISDVTSAADPDGRIAEWVRWSKSVG